MKKASKNYSADEVQRYLGALQEENRGHYKAIGERLEGINEKLDSHDQKLDSHTEMIGQMNIKISIIQEDIEFIKSGMKRKVDHDEFDALIRRVSVLERRVLK